MTVIIMAEGAQVFVFFLKIPVMFCFKLKQVLVDGVLFLQDGVVVPETEIDDQQQETHQDQYQDRQDHQITPPLVDIDHEEKTGYTGQKEVDEDDKRDQTIPLPAKVAERSGILRDFFREKEKGGENKGKCYEISGKSVIVFPDFSGDDAEQIKNAV